MWMMIFITSGGLLMASPAPAQVVKWDKCLLVAEAMARDYNLRARADLGMDVVSVTCERRA
jgi:hypothetical protein